MARNITTTNYSWPNPDPNDKINTAGYWGTDIYTCVNLIDSKLASVASTIPTVEQYYTYTQLGSNQAMSAGAERVILFSSTSFSAGSWICPTTGVYDINLYLKLLSGTTTANVVNSRIYASGVALSAYYDYPATLSKHVRYVGTITAAQTITANFSSGAVAETYTLQSGIYTQISIHRVY